jgi:hypothetical protein
MCPAGVHKDALGCEDSAKDKHCANHVILIPKHFTGVYKIPTPSTFFVQSYCRTGQLVVSGRSSGLAKSTSVTSSLFSLSFVSRPF